MLKDMLAARRPDIGRLMAVSAVITAIVALAPVGAQAASPGTLDSSFGSAGAASLGSNTRLFATAVQSNGDVVAVGESGAGTATQLLVARFTTSGALDSSFGTGGLVNGPAVAGAQGSLARALAIQPDGKIVVVGTATNATR